MRQELEIENFDQINFDKERNVNNMDSNGDKIRPLTLRKLLFGQAIDRDGPQATLKINISGSTFTVDPEDALVRLSEIDVESQWYISTALWPRSLKLWHYL